LFCSSAVYTSGTDQGRVGIMSAPTAKELEALANFRPLVSDLSLNDEQKSDMFMLRWLRARELNLKAAEEMLRKV
ncbi:unnamed protein product, partial [Allacma fusca]